MILPIRKIKPIVSKRIEDAYGHTDGNDLFKVRACARYSPNSSDISDWSNVGTASKSSNSNATYVKRGTTSLKVSGTTTGTEGALIYTPNVLSSFAVGDVARISGWVYITDAATSDPMEIRLYHQSYGVSEVFALDQTKLNQWQYFSLSKARVSGASAFSITFKPSDGEMYVDDVAVRKELWGAELADIANFSTGATGVSYSAGVLTFDNVSQYDISEETPLGVNGTEYRIEFTVYDYVKGELDVIYPFATAPNITGNGTYVFFGTCGAWTRFRIMADSSGGTTLKIKDISMREVL